MTTLPSVSSLRALRTFARRAKATRPFLGIGDPKLDGETGSSRGLKLASLFTPRGVADVNSVRQLASLLDKRMISGDVLNCRKGLLIPKRYETRPTASSRFPLTLPNYGLRRAKASVPSRRWSCGEGGVLLSDLRTPIPDASRTYCPRAPYPRHSICADR